MVLCKYTFIGLHLYSNVCFHCAYFVLVRLHLEIEELWRVSFGCSLPNLCKKKIFYKKVAAYGGSRSSLHPSKVKYFINLSLSIIIQWTSDYFWKQRTSHLIPTVTIFPRNVSLCPTFPISLTLQRLTDDRALGSVAKCYTLLKLYRSQVQKLLKAETFGVDLLRN